MQHWKRTTETANRLFDQGELVDAREHYLQALALAQVLFERWHDVDEAVAAFVIAHHNLADLHLRLNQPQESADYLCAAHQRLLQASQESASAAGAARCGLAPQRTHLHRTAEFHRRVRPVPAHRAPAQSPAPASELGAPTDLAPVPMPTESTDMPHTLPALPYAYDALEPHIDTQTMEIHHTKHHQTYINNLNAAIEGTEWAEWPVEKLVGAVKQLPENLRGAVINQGGGHANHSLFWTVMSPQGGGEPEASWRKLSPRNWAVSRLSGRSQGRADRFGSGWAWLSVTPQKTLVVESSGNQDSPLMHGNTPILGLDVWEHAYYLKYQNRRPEYIGAFYNVIDWAQVERRYLEALK
jgi:Fe-Mn family superoxide dismutase